jgi:hypothetical protein
MSDDTCGSCGYVHKQGFCWTCNTITGTYPIHWGYDCQRDTFVEIDHRGAAMMIVICRTCLPSIYQDRWDAAVERERHAVSV